MRNVLVVGGAGYIGSAVMEGLSQAGYDVESYDVKEGRDLFDEEMLAQALVGCECVVHLAAIPWPKPGVEWRLFWELNCVGVQLVAAAAERAGVRRLIYASSTAYYGFEEGFLPQLPVDERSRNATQIWEESALPQEMGEAEHARVFYMCSKVVAEGILAAYGLRRALEVVILRLCPTSDDAPPWLWGLYARRWRVVETVKRMVAAAGPLWYEVFNVAEPDVENVDTRKLVGFVLGTLGGGDEEAWF